LVRRELGFRSNAEDDHVTLVARRVRAEARSQFNSGQHGDSAGLASGRASAQERREIAFHSIAMVDDANPPVSVGCGPSDLLLNRNHPIGDV
jgi:hypothetical protein